MITQEELNKFFEVYKFIEETALEFAPEVERIKNEIWGYTFFLTRGHNRHPAVSFDPEEVSISVECYSNGNYDYLHIPLYAFTDEDWKTRYASEQQDKKDLHDKERLEAEETRKTGAETQKRKLYESLKKEFEG